MDHHLRPFVLNRRPLNGDQGVCRVGFPSCVSSLVSHTVEERAVLGLRCPDRILPQGTGQVPGMLLLQLLLSVFLHQVRNQASEETPKYHILYQPPQGNELFILHRVMDEPRLARGAIGVLS